MKMTIFYSLLFMLILSFTGCLFDSDETESEDKGNYTLEANPASVQSYRNGGGLFILIMEPDSNFQGNVRLKVNAAPALNARLTTESLSLDKTVAEVVIYPDSTTATGTYTIRVISEHADVKDELDLTVEIVEFNPLYLNPPDSKFIEFVQWVEGKYPHFVFKDGEKWFSYNHYPIIIPGAPSKWTFLNQTWDITVYSVFRPTMPIWFLLRKRGENDPMFAAFKDMNVTIHEIPVNEFGLMY